MAKNQVTLTFAGDSAKLEKSFDKVGASARNMEGQVGQASTKASGHFKRFGAAALAGTAIAGAALFKFGKDSIAAFTEAEQAQTKLLDAFARFPKLADTNIESLRKLNKTLATKTRFDDDAFASGQAVLAQFKLTGTQLKDLTPLLADYAAKTGQDLPSAAESLGKAFLGNTKALKSLGISYSASTKNVDALKAAAKAHHTEVSKGALALAKQRDAAADVANITALLRKQVGGYAEKEGKTAAGQAAIMSNQFGELKETLGQKLLPVMLKVVSVGLKVIDWIGKNKTVMMPLIGVIAAVTAAQWLWNIAVSANPIGLIIIGIAALIAVIVLVATKTRFFQNIWEMNWKLLKAIGAWFAGPFAGFFVDAWNFVVDNFKNGIDFIKKIPSLIGTAFKKIFGFITAPFRAAFNFVADAWNNTIGKLHWSVPKWVPGIGGNSISAPQLPKFHTGGVVPGAPGQEMVALLQAGERVTPAGASSAMVLELHSGGTAVDDLLVQILSRAVKARGGNVQVVLGR